MRARAALGGALATLVATLGLTGCVSGGGRTYGFSAVFASGQNLFPGSKVEVLGLAEGTVESVRPVGRHVIVTMRLPLSHPVPAGVRAAVVAPELLGQRSVDLEPGYTGGPKLADGAVIPQSRTSVPVETSTILREVTSYLQALQPANVHDAVSNLAQDLNGQGQALGNLITNAAGTIALLARKGDQLGQLNATLAKLTGDLDSRTARIESLITDYDSVAAVVAADRQALDGAIAALARASTQLAGLLTPNVTGLQADLATLTTVGRTLDRNLDSIDLGLSSSVALFAGAQRAYDPNHHWLKLNNQAPPALSSTLVADHLRDRLAGICRRLLAHHSQGLTPAQIATLKTCGDPGSGFFDPVLGLAPGPVTSRSDASTTESVYRQGLSQIPGLTDSQRQSLGAIPLASWRPAATSETTLSSATVGSVGPARPAVDLGPLPAEPVATSGAGIGSRLLGPFRFAWHVIRGIL